MFMSIVKKPVAVVDSLTMLPQKGIKRHAAQRFNTQRLAVMYP